MRTHQFWPVLLMTACAAAEEPARVELPVTAGAGGMAPVRTDLGYEVVLSEARIVVEDIEFTTAGEAHTSLWQRAVDWVIPAAHAHPGHYEGGDVIGELPGHFVIDLMQGSAPLGMATLIVGSYTSANFTFGFARESDAAVAGDALLGHTALLRGTATNAEGSVAFSIALDAPLGRELVGVPFEVDVATSSAFAIDFGLVLQDPLEGDSLFDGIDFARLAPSSEGVVEMGAASTSGAMIDAYNSVRRTFLTHDHFRFAVGY